MSNPADYFVSEDFGFLLVNPLETLPDYFEPWNHLATDMARLVDSNALRQQVDQMPLLDWTKLKGHRQKRLAHFQLTVIVSGYVWQHGEKGACKSLPACVAVPLFKLSEDIGLPPVLNHTGLALSNYAPIDSNKPLTLENSRALYLIPGGEEAGWFCRVTVMIELTFAKSIKFVTAALKGAESGDVSAVTSSLINITQVVKEMKSMLSRMHEKLSADTFFNILRPYLAGLKSSISHLYLWGGEKNPLPEGLIFEGISDQPIKAIGGSAAQSPTLQVLDALLGVQHAAEKRSFLLEMRQYTPKAFQDYIVAVENQEKSVQTLVNSIKNEELHKAYNALLSAIVDFRSYHIQIVTKYIVQASAKAKQSEDKRFESLDQQGTGGTNILPFLKDLRQDTKDCMTGQA